MTQPKPRLSRRDLLKLLARGAAAATGAAALSSVPVKWKTPIVEFGVLPAHAQASRAPGAISGTITLNVISPIVGRPATGILLIGTSSPVVIAGVISPPTGNVYPYLISNVPAGNNYIVTCQVSSLCPMDYGSAVTVNPGLTTPNINFDFTKKPINPGC